MAKRGLYLNAILVCAVWVGTQAGAVDAASLPAGRILLAGMQQSGDVVSYGAGSEQNASDELNDDMVQEHRGIQNRSGYIQYQAGPTQAQMDDTVRREQEKEAASLEMLQNMFIDLNPRPWRGPVGERPAE